MSDASNQTAANRTASAADAFEIGVMTLGEYVSDAHSGQKITWDDAFASELVLAPKSYTWDADPPVLPGPDGRYPHPIPGLARVL